MAAALNGLASLMLVMAVLSAVALGASAQEPVAAPAPAPDQGAAYSFGASAAVICSSLLLSVLAFLKH